MSRQLLASTTLVLTLGMGGTGCVNDLGPKPEPVKLAISATVEGLSSAASYTVSVQVGYAVNGGGTRSLVTSPSTFDMTSTGQTVSPPIAVILDPCLNDPERVDPQPGQCRLIVSLSVSDELGELAQATQDIGVVHQGEQKTGEAITLTPNYQLSITGGGQGTGSGAITVAAAGGQPELTCQITDGTAAAEGCSARYPFHTALVLTPGTGTLASWGNDCSTTPPASACALTMDAHRSAVAGFAMIPTTGDLDVQIAGLPAGIPAAVTVSNTAGFSQQVSQSQVLTGLQPGSYTVTAAPVAVTAENKTYTAEPPEQTVSVVVGQRATAQIGYNPPETGSLAVSVTGLAEGVGAVLLVTGPDGFSQALTTAQTLSGLTPGSYTIAAQNVETSDQVYVPQPVTQTQRVEANQTTQGSVAYAASRASLTVTVAGLPPGTNADVAVAGPNGYHQDVTQTTTPPLLKLDPGSYTVTANTVTGSDEQLYQPVVTPRQPIRLGAGESATVTVTYAVAPATQLVFVQQPTTTDLGAVVQPPVTVEARDAENRVVPGYAAPITLSLQSGGEPADATLGGTVTATPVNGVATFGDLTVDRPNRAYTLLGTSGNLTGRSDPFRVTSGTPVITSVDFPATVSNGPGTTTNATISYSDPGGDIAHLVVTEISDSSGIYTPRTFDVAPPLEGPPVVIVPLWECSAPRGCSTGSVTIDLTLVDREGSVSAPVRVSFSVAGSPPSITSFDFPKVLPGAANTFTSGTISFADPDGDVDSLVAVAVTCIGASGCGGINTRTNVSGQTSGQVPFGYGCAPGDPCYGIHVILRFVLVDVAGNRSAPVDVAFQFEDQPIEAPPSAIAGASRAEARPQSAPHPGPPSEE
jgi:hypothetical protein